MNAKKPAKIYEINYKHPIHGSDIIGHDFLTVAAAVKEIKIIQAKSNSAYHEWLADAILWVADAENGDIYWS